MSDDSTLPIIVLFWILSVVLFGFIGCFIGQSKGAGGAGFVLGALLGPVGCVLAAFLEGNRIPCPFCAERVRPEAKVCPHCRNQLPVARGSGSQQAEPYLGPRATAYPELPPTKLR